MHFHLEQRLRVTTFHFAIVLLLLGLGLLGSSMTYEPFKDPQVIEDVLRNGGPGYSATESELDAADMRYWTAWKAQLTPKFALEDYGATCLVAAIAIAAASAYFGVMRWGDRHRLVTPFSLTGVRVYGGVAAVLTGLAACIWFLIGMERREFPTWADTPGIAMCGGVGETIILLFVVAVMPMAGEHQYRPRAEVLAVFRRRTCPRWPWWLFYGLPLGLCLFALVRVVAMGDFLNFLPASLWVVFFGFLLAGQQRTMNSGNP